MANTIEKDSDQYWEIRSDLYYSLEGSLTKNGGSVSKASARAMLDNHFDAKLAELGDSKELYEFFYEHANLMPARNAS
jgi:hypothetical protein